LPQEAQQEAEPSALETALATVPALNQLAVQLALANHRHHRRTLQLPPRQSCWKPQETF
jgi:hypothetical protein